MTKGELISNANRPDLLQPGPLELMPKAPSAVTPMAMLQLAVEKGADLDQLQKLMDLQERWERNQAERAYVAAMARFKANPPKIAKEKHVHFTNRAGQETSYMHATLADVCDAATKGLADVGISHRWDVAQDGGRITVNCILTHKQGHSERTALSSMADDSGGKNSIQAIGSAVTYLQRYTLLAALGLAAKDIDNDGRGADEATIDANQVADLEALISETGADRAKFLVYCRVAALDDIPSGFYRAAVAALQSKRASK